MTSIVSSDLKVENLENYKSSDNVSSQVANEPPSLLKGPLHSDSFTTRVRRFSVLRPSSSIPAVTNVGTILNAINNDGTGQEKKEKNSVYLSKPTSSPLSAKTWFAIGMMPVIGITVPYFLWAIDIPSYRISGDNFEAYDYFRTLFFPTPNQSRAVMESILQTMGFLFGILITVVGIVLQLATTRFSSQVTGLFFGDLIITSSLAYIMMCNAFTFWVYLSISERYNPRSSVILSLIMGISNLVLLFPFFAYMFSFLEADKVIEKMMARGIKAAAEGFEDSAKADASQVKAAKAVENLMEAANKGVEKRDKIIASQIVDALCAVFIEYCEYKAVWMKKTPLELQNSPWFKLPSWMRVGPDFLTLSQEAATSLEEKKNWVEWKILRNYQHLFNEALKYMKELCYHISINTRKMGQTATECEDIHALDMILKFMNTYTRSGINKNDTRTVYNLLFQYRLLAEFIIDNCKKQRTKKIVDSQLKSELENRAVKVAKYLRYYANAVLFTAIPNIFLVETISYDLSPVHEKLLNVFLTVDDGSEFGREEQAIKGVRKDKIILATLYLSKGQTAYAKLIYEDLKEEPFKRLWSLQQELLNVTNKDLWEVSERGKNFYFLTREQKVQMKSFFAWFKSFDDTSTVPLTAAETKKFHREQVLLNLQ